MDSPDDITTLKAKSRAVARQRAVTATKLKKAQNVILTLQAELDELRLRPQALETSEKRFLALAIQSICNRQGPAAWPIARKVIEKLAIQDYLDEHLRNWIARSKKEGE